MTKIGEAALDLDTIWDYIAKDNIDGADRWIGGVHGSEPFCHGKRLAGCRQEADFAVVCLPGEVGSG